MKLAAGARVAAYYAPCHKDPLWQAGSAWLGRDAAGAAVLPRANPCGIARLTAAPRRYGFHATLKPPFRLHPGTGWDDVLRTARAVCRAQAPFAMPPLAVGSVDGFLALVERQSSPDLRGLADLLVEGLDGLRAPPGDAELLRRRALPLTGAQEDMLARWGYPAVFGLWRFHMTLSQRLTPAQYGHYLPAARRAFAASCATSRIVRDVCLFVQPGPDEDYIVAERIALG